MKNWEDDLSESKNWLKKEKTNEAVSSKLLQGLITFCGTEIGEQAEEGQSGWVLLPPPSPPTKPPAVQDS